MKYKYISYAYRAETGYTHDKKATALDVVRYEMDVLGNDLKVPQELFPVLAKRPASDIVWVTKSRKTAKKYGHPTLIKLPAGSIIIGTDGEDGYLILKYGPF
jgi:hypothetical protein